MWRRSGVKRRALVRWEARNARFLHHGVHVCWLKGLFSLIGRGSTIFAYECISHVLRPGARAPLLNQRFAHRCEFISTRLSLWCTASRHTCLFRRIPQTLCPSLILLKPSQAFPAADYKDSTCVSCWQTSVHKGLREGGTHWFKASLRKKMGSIYGEGIGPALWFEGCFWRKLVEKGECCLPVVQNMCVCAKISAPPSFFSPAASFKNKRCKPRLQNGGIGRKITYFFVFYLSQTPFIARLDISEVWNQWASRTRGSLYSQGIWKALQTAGKRRQRERERSVNGTGKRETHQKADTVLKQTRDDAVHQLTSPH